MSHLRHMFIGSSMSTKAVRILKTFSTTTSILYSTSMNIDVPLQYEGASEGLLTEHAGVDFVLSACFLSAFNSQVCKKGVFENFNTFMSRNNNFDAILEFLCVLRLNYFTIRIFRVFKGKVWTNIILSKFDFRPLHLTSPSVGPKWLVFDTRSHHGLLLCQVVLKSVNPSGSGSSDKHSNTRMDRSMQNHRTKKTTDGYIELNQMAW